MYQSDESSNTSQRPKADTLLMHIACGGCSPIQINRNHLPMDKKHNRNRSPHDLTDQNTKLNAMTNTVYGAQTVVVVADATTEIKKHAVEWAISNIVKLGDTVIFLAVIPSGLSGWKTWIKLAEECTQSLKIRRPNLDRRNGSLQNQINENCSDMLQQLHKICEAKKVKVTVKIVMATGKGVATVEARKLSATWVVLDKNMKNEAKSCLEQLQCNLAVVSGSKAPRILRLNLKQGLPLSYPTDSSSVALRSISETNIQKGFDGINSKANVKSGKVVYPESEKGGMNSSSTDLGTPFTTSDCGTSPSSASSDQSNSSCSKLEGSLVTKPEIAEKNSIKIMKTLDYSNDISATTVQGTATQSSPGNKSKSSEGRKFGSSFFASLQKAKDTKNESAGGHSNHHDTRIENEVRKSCSAPVSRSNSFAENKSDTPIGSKLLESNFFKEAEKAKSFRGVNIKDDTAASEMQLLSALLKSQGNGTDRIEALDIQKDATITKPRHLTGTALPRRKYLSETFEKPKTIDTDHELEKKRNKWSLERTSSIRKAVSLSKNSPAGPPPLCSICQHKSPIFGRPPLKFSYGELQKATSGFSDDNFLSEGGFGPVHKGVLPDGQQIAVKQHRMAGSQGDKEFCAEVEVLSCAQHRNVVMLIGFCIEGGRRLLVYEFVCNGSLDAHLFRKDEPPLEWKARKKVAIGAARGLRFLHEDCRVGCIVHRDLRPNNILLTHDFEPLVGDFGLARWQPDGELEEETRVIGTFGYLAPEYARAGQVSEKADVYSFGVILLELISGRKAIDFSSPKGQQCLTEWARPLMEDHAAYEMVDPRLENRYPEHEVYCMLQAASFCIRRDPHSRPRMAQVLRILEGDLQAASSLLPSVSPPKASEEISTVGVDGGFLSYSLPSNKSKPIPAGSGLGGPSSVIYASSLPESATGNPTFVHSGDSNLVHGRGFSRVTTLSNACTRAGEMTDSVSTTRSSSEVSYPTVKSKLTERPLNQSNLPVHESESYPIGNSMQSAVGDRHVMRTDNTSRTTGSRDSSPFPLNGRFQQNDEFVPLPRRGIGRFVSPPGSGEASPRAQASRNLPPHQQSGSDNRSYITSPTNSAEPSPTAFRRPEMSPPKINIHSKRQNRKVHRFESRE